MTPQDTPPAASEETRAERDPLDAKLLSEAECGPHAEGHGCQLCSVTDMSRCGHRIPPIPNCPRCLVRDLLEALKEAKLQMATAREIFRTQEDKEIPMQRGLSAAIFHARALIERAKLIVDLPADDDLIPAEDAPEAAASQDRCR